MATLSRHRGQSPSGESLDIGVPHWVHDFMGFSTHQRRNAVARLHDSLEMIA
jgi:hypothetical protein